MAKTSCTVIFGANALTIKQDATFSATDKQPFVDFDDLKIEFNETKWITFEPDMWLMDGNYHFMPSTPRVGYMSLSISDSGSSFSALPALVIIFDEVHSTVEGLTLHFSELTNDYADDISIEYYDVSDVLIRADDYTPSSFDFSTNQAVADFKKIFIFFNGTNKAYRFVRLAGIDFDELIRFTGNEIKEAHLVEQIDPSRITLPFNTLDLVLLSDAGEFNLANPSGLYASLQNYEPIEVYESVDNDLLFIGLFFLDEWDSKSPNEATFKLIDAIGLMDTITDLAGYIDATDGVIPDLFNDYFVTPLNIDFEIDPFWDTFTLLGWMPIQSYRTSLQKMIFALATSSIQSYATCARSREVQVKPITFAFNLNDPEFIITSDDKGLKSQLKLRPAVTRSDITSYVYGDGGTEQVFALPLLAGTHRVLFDAPYTDLSPTGATITASGFNYADLNVVSPGTVTIDGTRVTPIKKGDSQTNSLLAAGTKENIISVENTMIQHGNGPTFAKLVMNYYKQRHFEVAQLFAPLLTVGDTASVETQGGELIGYVEKLTTDLANGFVADVDIVGIIVPATTGLQTAFPSGKYNDDDTRLTYAGTWTDYAGDANPYNGDVHYLDDGQAGYVSFFMVGTSFKLIYTSSDNKGNVKIYVDFVLVHTLDQYNAGVLYQHEWNSGTLSGSPLHFVKLEKDGTADVIEIDAIEVT